MARKYIIWGSGGHAKVLDDIIAEQGGSVAALFDNNPEGKPALKNVPLFIGEKGFNEWAAKNKASEYYGLVAIGGSLGNIRLAIHEIFLKAGVKLEAITDPSAKVSPSAKIGAGVHVMAQTLVAAEAVIGDQTIINHKASVDHECIIGKGVHLAPGVTICGMVELGDNVMVAAGATIISRIKVGANSIIGAGSVVVRDIPANVVAYGNPAKVIRKIES